MINTIDKSINLEYKIVSSLQEAAELGESMPYNQYHILIKPKKKRHIIALVYHTTHTQCEFCRIEEQKQEAVIWID